METKLLYAALVGCLPSVLYLGLLICKRMRRSKRRVFPDGGATQFVLAAVSVFCFGVCLFLVIWNFATPLPYYHREKSLIIALLFLLMGILCIQVMQFVRLQNTRQRPVVKVAGQAGRNNQRHVVRPYVISGSKS